MTMLITQPPKANRTARSPIRRRSAFAAIAGLASAALLVAGCGGASASGGPGPSAATFTAAAFKYASCMRAHGVPSFPDPAMTDHDGQQVAYLATPSALIASPAFKRANKICQRILTPVLDTTGASLAAQAAKEQHMVAFAKCMRSHSVPSFPDPTSQGKLSLQMLTNAGVDLHAPAVFAAAKTCLPAADGAISAQQIESAVGAAQ
jgi:hypothetical protein